MSEQEQKAPTQIVSSEMADMKEERPSFMERMVQCQDSILRFFKIDMIMEADLDDEPHDITRPEIQKFRQEVNQLHRMTRKLSNYLCLLTFVYFLMAVYTYMYMDIKPFFKYVRGASKARQLYNYATTIEIMKIVHSLTLISISVFVNKLVRAKKVLTEKQYRQMFVLITIACLIYFVPVIYMLYLTYADNTKTSSQTEHQVAWTKFARYVHVMLNKLDFSGWGYLIAYLIHLQIYAILLGLQLASSRIRSLVNKVQEVRKLNEAGAGSYDALELNSIIKSAQIDLETPHNQNSQDQSYQIKPDPDLLNKDSTAQYKE